MHTDTHTNNNTDTSTNTSTDTDTHTPTRTTLSFYRYVHIDNPQELRDALMHSWGEMGVLGRIYLAHEGINAQLSLPTQNVAHFRQFLDSSTLCSHYFAKVPFKIALSEDVHDPFSTTSFTKLTIKVRPKLVADGLPDDAFDTSDVGKHLTAKEFNDALDAGAIVIDMRNNYESLIGHFDGAILPKADNFRDELKEVLEILETQLVTQTQTEKDQQVETQQVETQIEEQKKADMPILVYCTGGIRCEKASAWLRHHGYKNVSQLHGGIIDYAHQIEREKLPTRFRGVNFVFDGRLSERVSDDVVSTCMQCGAPSDRITNCVQVLCNLLLVQCETCASTYHNCCSPSCQTIHGWPQEKQTAWRKGKRIRSTRIKAVVDGAALQMRIHQESIRIQQGEDAGAIYMEMEGE